VRVLVIIALLMSHASGAWGQDAEAKKQAKAAFERAVDAEHRKDWRTAIEEFQTAYDLVPHADVLHNIAMNFERLEELRDAATYYRRYLDESDDPPDRKKIEKLIAKLKARPGLVTIESDPEGAEVEIDGTRRGITPLELELSGSVRVTITGNGSTHEEDIVVEFGEPRRIEAVLAAKTGMVVISGNVPGAEVAIDGEPVGRVPVTVNVSPGRHRVLVTAEGWASLERDIEVPSEGSTQVAANLVRPLGYVEPVQPEVSRHYFMWLSAGTDSSGETGGIGAWMFGAEQGKLAGALGYGYVNHTTSFALALRVSLTKGVVRPYLRSDLYLGTSTAFTGSVGILARWKYTERGSIGVFVDVGAGRAKTSDDFDADVTWATIIPVVGGVQFSY
jgi:hypothetical protein